MDGVADSVETRIFISSDHRGFECRQSLLEMIADLPRVMVEDLGPDTYDKDDDFNDAAIKVCKKVLENPGSKGILLCGSAIGITMQANRFKGVRAAAAYSPEIAKLAREHEDANILCLSADLNSVDQNYEIIKAFLETEPASDERYSRRIRRLDEGKENYGG